MIPVVCKDYPDLLARASSLAGGFLRRSKILLLYEKSPRLITNMAE